MTTATTDQPTPPRDYGNGDTWADDGPWAVPERLRVHYAAAEPSDLDRQAYVRSGVDVVEDRTYEVQRVADAGDSVRPPRTVMETVTHPTFVHLGGSSGYQQWLHGKRLTIAVRAQRAADRQAAREARWLSCRLCGTRSGQVQHHRVPERAILGRSLTVAACANCLPAVADAARAALATRNADRLLPDGRRVGDAATALVADLLNTTEATP